MLSKLSSKICIRLIRAKALREDEYELYQYGFFLLLSHIVYILVTLLLGLAFHCILEMVIFYIAFSSIREYAGGFHADTEMRCEIITTLSFLGVAFLISASENTVVQFAALIASALAGIVVFILSPLDTAAKPLDREEKKKYRKISLLILVAIVCTIGISLILKLKFLWMPCCLSLILEAALLVAGKIKGDLVKT